MGKSGGNVVAVRDGKRSRPWDVRFVLVDAGSGEVVDDANGWGYRTPDRAYASWRYQCRNGRARDLQVGRCAVSGPSTETSWTGSGAGRAAAMSPPWERCCGRRASGT